MFADSIVCHVESVRSPRAVTSIDTMERQKESDDGASRVLHTYRYTVRPPLRVSTLYTRLRSQRHRASTNCA